MKNKVSMIGNKVNIVSKFLFVYFSILFCNAMDNVNFRISKHTNRNMHTDSIYINTAYAREKGYNFSYTTGNNINCTVYNLIKSKNKNTKQDNIEMISGFGGTDKKIKSKMKKNEEMSRGIGSNIGSIKNVKSKIILKEVCDFVFLHRLLSIINYNKELQNVLNVKLQDYSGLTIIAVFDVEDKEKVEYIIKNKNDHIKNSIYKVECKEEDGTKKITVVARYSVNEFVKIYENLENDNQFKKYWDIEEDKDSLDGKIRKVFIKLFSKAKSLKLIGLNIFGEKLSDLFSSFKKLEELNLSNFNTSKVNDMEYMFCGCKNLKELNLSDFNTNNVTKMTNMFYGCSSLKELNLSNFNTSKVTNMAGMFSGCSSLKKINLSNFNTNSVIYMDHMFYECSSLEELNLYNFNTSKVTNMAGMFSECSSLKKINLSNFSTSNVSYMSEMFDGCSSLKELNLSNFNTNNVNDIYGMFGRCSLLKELNLSNFNTSKVENMGGMFIECNSLTSLDLSSFNTSSVTDMSYMFAGCSNLYKLNLSNFNTNNVTRMGGMFNGCNELKNNVTTNDEKIKNDYAQFIKKDNK